ncbi:hypothetical protein T05_2983 [Trichinella murrelli]|uniref:Uncharacterized protein n=1 Tax=Trichinella murrelli TaxID=144512 RepID=A0A0V0U0U9_9BILA|nr:hypothetical protein T05_2983 [Trichinella murrelli]
MQITLHYEYTTNDEALDVFTAFVNHLTVATRIKNQQHIQHSADNDILMSKCGLTEGGNSV